MLNIRLLFGMKNLNNKQAAFLQSCRLYFREECHLQKKRPTTLFILAACILALGIGGVYILYRFYFEQNIGAVQYTKHTDDMESSYSVLCYQDNQPLLKPEAADFTHDIKYVFYDSQKTRLVDYAHGFLVDLPQGSEFDSSFSKFTTKAYGDGWKADISREHSPYEDTKEYIEYYYNRFMVSKEFQKNNNITLHEDGVRQIGPWQVRIISLTRTPYEGSDIKLNSYTYAYIIDPDRPQQFIRFMIKAEKYDPIMIDNILASFRIFSPTGEATYQINTTPAIPKWNDETKALYETLKSRDDIMWGVYTHKLIDPSGLSRAVFELEDKLDYKFPLVMGYTYLSDQPPLKGMQEAYENGKITELTLQVSTINNAGLDSLTNPNFEVLDGKKDDILRSFARGIKSFGHPVILRVNNEMNTDWASYSGVVTLCDPDIYKQVHTRIFNIFQQEGVDNVIWVFNPQYGDYPPANWNHYLNYYPGNDQIQMLGVTAYNTGDYYYEKTAERWHSFDELYSGANELYQKDFGRLPWIITEFSCSSYGGNKANWIRNMFYDIRKYKNIKAAVWFSFADYDPDKEGVIARPYFLDETPQTTQAFKDGLHGIITSTRLPEN